MKTIVNRIESVIANEVSVILDTKTNKLMQVVYDKSIAGLDGSVTHVFINNNKEYRIPQNSDHFKMFDSLDDFERSKEIESTAFFLDACRTKQHFKFRNKESRDIADIVSISFVNGVPVEVEAPVSGFEVQIGRRNVCVKPIFEEGVNLDDYFDKVENAVTFHDYKVTADDGKETTIKGRCHYLLPTDEQKPVVEELRAVIEKMREVGLGLMLNTSYGTLHVYNCKKTFISYEEGDVSISDINLPESIKLPNPIYNYEDEHGYQISERIEEEK